MSDAIELRFVLEGRPVSWARKNVLAGGRVVTSREQRAAKERARCAALAARPRGWDRDGEYAVSVAAYYPDRRMGDADRIPGILLDAMEGVAYETDRQVGDLRVRRFVDRERPRVEVCVSVMEAE